jgi:hypothetical protein
VSVGDTLEEASHEIREAIEFHLEGMREDGLPIPEPPSWEEYVELGSKPREETARSDGGEQGYVGEACPECGAFTMMREGKS